MVPVKTGESGVWETENAAKPVYFTFINWLRAPKDGDRGRPDRGTGLPSLEDVAYSLEERTRHAAGNPFAAQLRKRDGDDRRVHRARGHGVRGGQAAEE